jgi:2-C-methyl-D-erythritol 4-phosphate cytidylyltransferase
MLSHIALIVAGGSGSRMNSHIPKQFMLLHGKPVLMHTLQAFTSCTERVLVLPQHQLEVWQELCNEHHFLLSHRVVVGGNTRYQSVKNGLLSIDVSEEAIVSIHDGVRPLIDEETIEKCYTQALQSGNAIAAVKSKDSVRLLHNNQSQHINRDSVYLVQTPQTFKLSQILHAYQSVSFADTLTDDASVAEAAGYTIHLCEGNYRNIKITTPEDMAIAHVLMA